MRNKPGRISNFSWFKIWEPNGTSTVEGPLNAPSGFTSYTYPLGFDITADGKHLVYGYSNSGSCCPTRSRLGRMSDRRQTARSTRSTPAARRTPRSSAHGSSRSRTPPPRRSSTSRTRAPATLTRTTSPRGSTPRGSRSTSKASTSRPTGAWRHSGSRSGTAGRRRSAGSTSSRSRVWISRPRSRLLLPARGRHRTGRIARAGRRGDRVEGRRRREGRRPTHGHRRSLRVGKRAGRAVADRRVPVDRRCRRGRVPARTAADAARRPRPGGPGATRPSPRA